jgi:two-component system, OmpR family, response regulator PhoP
MTDYRLPASYPSTPSPYVFVLEGNLELREGFLLPLLRSHGFLAQGAATAADFYRAMRTQRFDLLILDIGLPDEDGFAVAQRVRAICDMGIVMLAGHSQRQHHLDALNSGADFFLTKPVDIDLLITTLHTLARRVLPQPQVQDAALATTSTTRWRLIDRGWWLVSPQGKRVPLSASERCVVIALVTGGDAPVSRDLLIHALTDNADDFDPHRLDMMIFRLRRKVQAITKEMLPLITVRNTGYLFSCDGDSSISSSS